MARIKVSYSYRNYPGYPKITAYSRFRESMGAGLQHALLVLTFLAGLAFLGVTWDFFEKFGWETYLQVAGGILLALMLDHHMFICYSNTTRCREQIKLLRAKNAHMPRNLVDQACRELRKKKNAENRRSRWIFLLAALSGELAVIGALGAVRTVVLLSKGTGSVAVLLWCIGILAVVAAGIVVRVKCFDRYA